MIAHAASKKANAGARYPHADFARRFESACDENPDVPPPHHGRLIWFVTQFENRFQVTTTSETVRRWLAGISRPKPQKLAMLAQILKVDEAWLSVGTEGEIRTKREVTYGSSMRGEVNLVAALIEMDGGTVAFGQGTETDTSSRSPHFFAIVKGAQYSVHVEKISGEGDEAEFVIPAKCEGMAILGVRRTGPTCFEIYDIPWDVITEKAVRKSGHFHLSFSEHKDALNLLEGFAKRF